MSAKNKTTKAKERIKEPVKLSPSEYRKMIAFDRQVESQNAANHKKLVLAIAELIAENPYVEWAIVSNYLKRKNKMLVSRPEDELTALLRPDSQPKRERPSRS